MEYAKEERNLKDSGSHNTRVEQDHPNTTIKIKKTHLDLCSGFLQLTTFFNECLPLNEHNMYAFGGPHSMLNPWVIHFLPVFEPNTTVETHSLVSLACKQPQTL
jgi:hypothetical protein